MKLLNRRGNQSVEARKFTTQIILTHHSEEFYIRLPTDINPEIPKIDVAFSSAPEFLLCENKLIVSSLRERGEGSSAQSRVAETFLDGIVYTADVTVDIVKSPNSRESVCYLCIAHGIGPNGDDILVAHDACARFGLYLLSTY